MRKTSEVGEELSPTTWGAQNDSPALGNGELYVLKLNICLSPGATYTPVRVELRPPKRSPSSSPEAVNVASRGERDERCE